MTSGKAADMKMAIAGAAKSGIDPRLVIMDVPRSKSGYVSYTGMEEIKNACFLSSKYEVAQYVGAHPHMLVFANTPPEWHKMSGDRWKVFRIVNGQMQEQDYTGATSPNFAGARSVVYE